MSRSKPLSFHLKFGGYTLAGLGACYFFGSYIMYGTNPETKKYGRLDEARESVIRGHQGVDQQMLANANKQRLQVLLDEVKNRSDDARYKAALQGYTLGTHRVGTTKGSSAIEKDAKQ